jgi:hypothetical protein
MRDRRYNSMSNLPDTRHITNLQGNMQLHFLNNVPLRSISLKHRSPYPTLAFLFTCCQRIAPKRLKVIPQTGHAHTIGYIRFYSKKEIVNCKDWIQSKCILSSHFLHVYITNLRKKSLKIPIRIRISKKNRQHNGQKKKYKRTNNEPQSIHIKLKIEYHEPH